MPPKYKFTKEQIVSTTLDIVRGGGLGSVTARSVGQALNSSSKVIFSLFQNMEELQNAVTQSAYERYLSFLQQDIDQGKYPPYKAMGMAYIRFATEEKELFRLLFMCDRRDSTQVSGQDFDRSVELIQQTNNISKEQATLMHTEMWVCVHGIAAMQATSFLTLEEEMISRILSDTYFGLQHRHTEKEA